jgi:hypothetical protein
VKDGKADMSKTPLETLTIFKIRFFKWNQRSEAERSVIKVDLIIMSVFFRRTIYVGRHDKEVE